MNEREEITEPEEYMNLSPGSIFLTCLDDSKTLMNGIISIKQNPSQTIMNMFLDLNRILPKIDDLLSNDTEHETGSFESLIYTLKNKISKQERETCFSVIENYLNYIILSARNMPDHFKNLKFAPVKAAVMKDLYIKIRQEIR